METRRALRARIAELEAALAHERGRSALIDAADLPKCKSIACYNCKNVVYVDIPATGEIFLLGCGKNITCKDFVFKGGAPEWTKDKTVLMASGERRELLPVMQEPLAPLFTPCSTPPGLCPHARKVSDLDGGHYWICKDDELEQTALEEVKEGNEQGCGGESG